MRDVLLNIIRHKGDCTKDVESCIGCPLVLPSGTCEAFSLIHCVDDIPKLRLTQAVKKYIKLYKEDSNLFEALL